MALPTCDCVPTLSIADKFGAIYCAFRELAQNDPSLPECDCIGAYSIEEKLNLIYCAMLIWAGS